MKTSTYYWFVLLISFSFLVSACGVSGDSALAQPAVIPPASATALPLPTNTLLPTQTVIPGPTVTPVSLHPLQIEAMRAREYPGSDIVIEEVLDRGVCFLPGEPNASSEQTSLEV